MPMIRPRVAKVVWLWLLVTMSMSGAVSAASPEPASPVPTESPALADPTPAPSPAPPTRLEGHWTRIPKAPWGSAFPAAVAIDGKMLVLDRETGRLLLYDPESRKWQRRTRTPKRIDSVSPWVWTGDELIVFDVFKRRRIFAYDPDTDAWRTLPKSPFSGARYGTRYAVWADGRIIIADSRYTDDIEERTMAMFDMATSTWTELAPAPGANRLVSLHWTGSEVLAVTSDDYGTAEVTSLDPVTSTWSESVAGPVSGIGIFPESIWTGDRLVFSANSSRDDIPGVVTDASFDPVTDTWQVEDFDCPVLASRSLWTGRLLVTGLGDHALDPVTGECFFVPGRGRTPKGNMVLWTGDRVIYWSGGGEEGSPYKRDGGAFVLAKADPPDPGSEDQG